jgi:hypothetical protein
MAVEIIQIEVEVETKDGEKKLNQMKNLVKTSIGEFENLNEAISKTQDELGKLDPKSDAFKAASKDLSDLKDRLRDTEAQSLRFTEALAQQPGVIGLVGQSMEGLRGTFKLFMANPIIAVVAAIAGVFITLKESLTKTTEGQETLNRISAAFGKIIGPVMAIVEKVALPIFEKLADLLALVAEGFSKFAKFLGISEAKIEEASRNSSEVLQEAYDEEQKRQEDETKKLEEENKKRAEERKRAAEKKKEDDKRAAEELAKQKEADLKEAQKIQLEAELSLLSDRDREIKEREMRFQEEMLALKKAGFTDFTAIEEEYRLDLKNINDTYDKEAEDREQARKEKELADAQELADKLRDARLAELDFKEYEAQVNFDADVQRRQATYQDELDLFDKIREITRERLALEGATAEQLVVFDKESQTQRTQIAEMQEEQRLGVISNALGTAASLFGEHTAAAKGLSVAQAIIDTYAGANKALGAYPPPFGAIAAGTVIAAGLMNVKKILSTKQPKLPGGKGGASESSTPTPSFSAPPAIQVPQLQTATGQSPQSQIAQTISTAVTERREPLKAYVVSQDISSAQALSRRTDGAATFGGG